jgi:hypothetical protein
MNDKSWLDVLTDGQLLRDWFALFAHFFLVAGFATAIGLSFVLIGLPLLLFMLASARKTAAMDRQLMAAILGHTAQEVEDDLNLRGANLGERLGAHLGSLTTWRSLLYLLLQLPIGCLTLMTAFTLLPFIALEVLILAPLTIDMRLLTVRILHGVATGLYRFNGLLLPTRKRKRAPDSLHNRLEAEDDGEVAYYLDDDGEIAAYRR